MDELTVELTTKDQDGKITSALILGRMDLKDVLPLQIEILDLLKKRAEAQLAAL